MFDKRYLPPASLEFVVISDTHYMLDTGGRAVEFESRRRQTARAERALRLAASLEAAFVIHLGDLVQEYPETLGFPQAVAEAMAQLAVCGVRPYQVAGNHDVGDKPDPTMPTDWVTPVSLAGYHERHGCSWRAWDEAGCHFISLNSQIMNSVLPEAAKQQAWLEADLAAHAGQRLFLFLHLAPFLAQEEEPGLGHYDNIDQPARRWLLDLVRRYRVELMVAGHSHFAFFNRVGPTRFYGAASPAFTRPGFSQLFSAAPPPEQGRDDRLKLGFYLVRVQPDGSRVHFLRTRGETGPVEPTTPYLASRLARDLPHSPLGLSLHHPLAQMAAVPIAWPSIIRQPVRNDYPLLSCVELGVQTVSIPASDLADPLQSQRLAYLREEGVQLQGSWLWAEPFDLAAAVQPHQEQLDRLELQLLGALWPDERCLQAIHQAEAGSGLPLALCPVIPRERVPGKQHQRTRFGYRPAELAELTQRLAHHQARLSRVICRVDAGASPWETMGQALELAYLDTVDWRVEFATTSEQEQANRAAEALFAAALWPGSRLFLEPLIDLDRTMDISYGLLDRLCNPRPVFEVVRCLNTLLFAQPEPRRPLSEPTLEGLRALGLASPQRTLWLLLPQPSSGQPAQLDLSQLADFGNDQAVRVYGLEGGMSQLLPAGQTVLGMTEAMLLVFEN